jgi:ABC-type polysaccharide/polyol phosphate export permease
MVPFAKLWGFRGFLGQLIVRNLRVKFQRSLLGFTWTLLNPLLTVGVLALVFSHVIRIPMPGYWAFLLSGFFAWNFTIQTLNSGTYILQEHSRLLRSVAFPPELLVIGASLSKLIEYLGALTLALLAITVFYHHGVPASTIVLPLLIGIQLVLVIGLTLPIAALSAFYHDVQHALPVALTTLFYVSPVFYPASLVPERFRSVYMLNPIADIITLFHVVVYEGRFPELGSLIGVSVTAIVVFGVGYWIFRKYAGVYAEVV